MNLTRRDIFKLLGASAVCLALPKIAFAESTKRGLTKTTYPIDEFPYIEKPLFTFEDRIILTHLINMHYQQFLVNNEIRHFIVLCDQSNTPPNKYNDNILNINIYVQDIPNGTNTFSMLDNNVVIHLNVLNIIDEIVDNDKLKTMLGDKAINYIVKYLERNV